MSVFKISRRSLLWGAAGAVVVAGGAGLWLGVDRLADRHYRRPVKRDGRFAPSVFLAIDSDGATTLWLTRSEMGQGAWTAVPMLIAEELDADWSRVVVEQAIVDTRHNYGSLFTAGSSGLTSKWIELRRAGAIARAMLVAAAARQWNVPRSSCTTASGIVHHAESARSATYGSLAQAASRERVPLRATLKSPRDFVLIGRNRARLDSPMKVSGDARYGTDVRLPGLHYAVIARAPAIGSTVRDFDDRATRAIRGVVAVVAVPQGVAVVADSTFAALRGREALTVRWNPGALVVEGHERIASRLRMGLDDTDAAVAHRVGDARTVIGGSDSVVAADYEVPFLAHATMEPMNCTARFRDGACEVWVPTQGPDDARTTAAQVAQIPPERVIVHTTLLGGGFGRRAVSDFVAEAVEVSKLTGLPVQVFWTRDDDLRHDRYRDASAHRLRAAVDARGYPIAWWHRIVSATPGKPEPGVPSPVATMGAANLLYRLPQQHVDWRGIETGVPYGIWRSVGYSYNTFAIECFIDELAEAAGVDALDYRRQLLAGSPRLLGCLERVAQMSGWNAHRSRGRALGLAVCACFGSFIAVVAEVVVHHGAQPRVSRVWCAVDCGIAVMPDTVVAQIEGGVVFALSAALFGKIHFVDGAVAESNFDRYRLLRINETPAIDVALVSSDEPPGGIGEVGVPAVAPAVANAWRVAIGKRVRHLPLINSA